MENTPVQDPSVQSSDANFPKLPSKNILLFLGAILLAIVLVTGALVGFNNRDDDSEDKNNQEQETVGENIAPYTLVYGSWTESGSEIMVYDLSNSTEYLLAKLPIDIKKVTVISPTKLLYIHQTDVRDHGREVVTYDPQTKQTEVVLRAAEGYGIDDYVLSPNKEYIATWEVQVSTTSGVLLGGKSRVYTARIGDQTKNLIYDEASTPDNPVRYPRAILDNGTVFMDRFLPNSGAGWAYGMSMSNFQGTDKKDLENMQNGTYGTQPVLSPDGKYLAFAGYDGSRGDGKTEKNGFRQSLLTTNTIELLDVSTLERRKLTNLPHANSYEQVKWIQKNNNTFFSIIAPIAQLGDYSYTHTTQEAAKLALQTTDQSIIEMVKEDLAIGGTIFENTSAVGNLGDTYSATLKSLSVLSEQDPKTIASTHQLLQYIALFDNNYFNTTSLEKVAGRTNKQLQLQTFHIKSELPEKRGEQQSERTGSSGCIPGDDCYSPPSTPPDTTQPNNNLPKCADLIAEKYPSLEWELRTCQDSYPKPPPFCTSETWTDKCKEIEQQNYLYQSQMADCAARFGWAGSESEYVKKILDAKNSGLCYDSPLYLYGTPGTKVSVQIHTPIHNSSATHKSGKYEITLGRNGEMIVGGKTYTGIEYDYTPAIRKITPPKTGTVVERQNVEHLLRDYAAKLGLNTKETEDLVIYGKKVVTGSYVFISFFDHETSHAILPITFDPTPDVYRNIVFYFKNLDKPLSYSIMPPTFDPIKRTGFTAVEVSGMVE